MTPKALLEFKDVSKAFGLVKANHQVSFQVPLGTVHALVGENGAGKSTIMNILFGLYQKDSGQIFLRGRELEVNSPLEAKKKGIGMVHQHFMLAGPLTAVDHIFLDEASGTRGLSLFRALDRKAKLWELHELSKKYQMPVPWERPVSELSVGFQQRIEILKLLYHQADILIFDEPTAVLTPQETATLFSQLRELKNAGKTILLITHKLKEVMSLADDVTVFSRGTAVAARKVSETNPVEISELMIGRKLKKPPAPTVAPSPDIHFEIRDVSIGKLRNLNLRIHHSEIVGIAGVEGNGQSELIELLLNPGKFSNLTGGLFWKGQSILKKSAFELRQDGFSYFPEDRLRQGALLPLDLENNFILGQHRSPSFQKGGWLDWKRIRKTTERALRDYDIRPPNPLLAFQNLSGGNQQKLVVARELFKKPSFLLAAQPTRGVDIGAIERIHSEIQKIRDSKGSVLLISSELDELMELSDRIAVLFRGQIVGELHRSQFDESLLGRWMTGALS